MPQHAYFHQLLLLALVLLFATLQWLLGLSLNQQMLFFLTVTLSIGMFHGMLDIVLLQQGVIAKNFSSISLLYAVFAVLCVLILLALPFLTIPILLLISVWHFGEQQGEKTHQNTCPIQRIVMGGAAVSMPYLLALPALKQLLQLLQLDTTGMQIALYGWQLISLFWTVVVAMVLVLALFNRQHWLKSAYWLELGIVVLAFIVLPPLLAFSLYFGAYHALRHIRDVLRTNKSFKSFKNQYKWILLVALASACLLATVAAYLANKNFAISTNIASSQLFHATLILLVAVTLPHAFLVTLWRKKFHHKSL